MSVSLETRKGCNPLINCHGVTGIKAVQYSPSCGNCIDLEISTNDETITVQLFIGRDEASQATAHKILEQFGAEGLIK